MKVKNIISLKNVTKSYLLRHEKPTLIENIFYRSKYDLHYALRNISFNVKRGETLGILGKNGSGKTTLLKIIAGITKQQKGKVTVKGRVVSLIDLSAGFHQELTGEENIYLNGLVIGMSRAEIESKFKKIVKFADIGKFIDSPLYTYSSGMKLRLGFSIAVHADPDIFLLDEGFAVGDDNFREKAYKTMKKFKKQGKTLIMVSHWMEELKRNCNSFLLLSKGKVIAHGGKEVIKKYQETL